MQPAVDDAVTGTPMRMRTPSRTGATAPLSTRAPRALHASQLGCGVLCTLELLRPLRGSGLVSPPLRGG